MRMKAVGSLVLCGVLAAWVLPVQAQEGHPLKGTWYGDFGTESERHDLTILLDWDGQRVTGVIHPGPDAIPIRSAVMDITPGVPAPEGRSSVTGTPPEFRVRFEVDAPNSAGGVDRFRFEGQIFNPVAGNRRIVGTWTCGDESGSFQIRRL